jgi:hypothetical protein
VKLICQVLLKVNNIPILNFITKYKTKGCSLIPIRKEGVGAFEWYYNKFHKIELNVKLICISKNRVVSANCELLVKIGTKMMHKSFQVSYQTNIGISLILLWVILD